MRRLTGLALLTVALAGCGAGREQPAVGEPAEAASPEPTAVPDREGFLRSGDIQFRILGVARQDTEVVVRTRILNGTGGTLRLCEDAIHTELLDEDFTVYPADRGTDDCAEAVTPDAVVDTRFRFSLPAAEKPSAFALRDDSDPGTKQMLNTVHLE